MPPTGVGAWALLRWQQNPPAPPNMREPTLSSRERARRVPNPATAGRNSFCSAPADSCVEDEGGVTMKEFKVYVADKTGELARVTEALSNGAVNIRAIASESKHDASFLRVVTSDVQTTQKALTNAGLKYELSDILNLELLDRPGELAKVAKRLARAAINVQSIYILGSKNGRTEIALVVDHIERAKTAIK